MVKRIEGKHVLWLGWTIFCWLFFAPTTVPCGDAQWGSQQGQQYLSSPFPGGPPTIKTLSLFMDGLQLNLRSDVGFKYTVKSQTTMVILQLDKWCTSLVKLSVLFCTFDLFLSILIITIFWMDGCKFWKYDATLVVHSPHRLVLHSQAHKHLPST